MATTELDAVGSVIKKRRKKMRKHKKRKLPQEDAQAQEAEAAPARPAQAQALISPLPSADNRRSYPPAPASPSLRGRLGPYCSSQIWLAARKIARHHLVFFMFVT
jgi:hypothetical protein